MYTADTIKAIQGSMPTFRTMEKKEAASLVLGAVQKMYFLRGFTVADGVEDEIKKAADYLTGEVMNRWWFLTAGELMLALEAGCCGEYGQDKRFCIANYMSWINTFCKSDERRDAMKGRPKTQAPRVHPSELLPPEEASKRSDRLRRAAVLKAWEDYKEIGMLNRDVILLDGWAARLTDYLIEKGKLKPTNETIRTAVGRTRTRSGALICDMKEAFNKILADGLKAADWACKRELLSMYFENLKTRGVELQL